MQIPIAQLEKFVMPAKDESNSPMKHLWLDVEGKRLVSTNGHMAARVSISVTENDVTGLIPIEAMDLARKELKAILKINKDSIPDPWLDVVAGEDAIVIQNLLTNTTHTVVRRKLEGSEAYPTIDAVFPQFTDKPSVSLSASYLVDIAKGLEADAISLWVNGDEKCVALACAGGTTCVVLMPQRVEIAAAEVGRRGKP